MGNNIAGDVLVLSRDLMIAMNKTAVEGNKLEAELIKVEGQMASVQATCTLKAGYDQAKGQAISGGAEIISGTLAVGGSTLDMVSNMRQLSELNNVGQNVAEDVAVNLNRVGADPAAAGRAGAAGRDPGLSDARLDFERAKIKTKYKTYSSIGQMIMQGFSPLVKGIGSMAQSAYTASGAEAQADAQRADAVGKALASMRAAVNSVTQGAQSTFGQLGNGVSQSLQYVIAMSQAH